MPSDPRALLVFFTSRRSGPARRMDSLVAHLAGRRRDAIALRRVDIDEHPDLAARFGVSQVPSIALVRGKRIVARLEGRSTAPKIEALLREHLGGDGVAA